MNVYFPKKMEERVSTQDGVGRGERIGGGTAFVQEDYNVTVSALWRRSLVEERREDRKAQGTVGARL